jgi:glycosyltransferase involved in cell wall biosynthesis
LIPVVSIIVPSFNKEKYISETIDSVISQTYFSWEMLIIDDVSTDKTIEIISSYSLNDKRIHLHVNPENKGANYSRNFGLKQALGKYIIFLDADDLLSVNCIENRIKHIQNSSFDFCVFTMQIFRNKVGDLTDLWKPDSKQPLNDFLSHTLPWQTMQPIWKKEFLNKLNGFDEDFKRMQDVEIHTRALFEEHVKFKQITQEPDCFYRIDEDRKNFGHHNFLNRWVESAILYFFKFYDKANIQNKKNYLMGTLFKTYLQILYYYKTKHISKIEYLSLKNKLFNNEILKHVNFKNKLCFYFSGFYNLLPFKIPGVNFIIHKILIY